MKRLYEYDMLDPHDADELPEGQVKHEVFKDEIFGCWGKVTYDRPLTGNEIDKYNLDGPVMGWA